MAAVLLRAENTPFIILLLLSLHRVMFKLRSIQVLGSKHGVCWILTICVKLTWTDLCASRYAADQRLEMLVFLTAQDPHRLRARCRYTAAQAVLPFRKPVGFLGFCQECQSSENQEKWSVGYKMDVSLEMTLRTARKSRVTRHAPLQSFPFSAFLCKIKWSHYLPLAKIFAFRCGFQGVAPMHVCLS